MKIYLSLVVFLSWQSTVQAQFNFPNDTSFHPFREKTLYKIDSIFKLSKDNDFELRVWSTYVKMNGWSLFILTNNKGTWLARLFGEKRKDNFNLDEKIINKQGLTSLWDKLLEQQILSLQGSEKLKGSTGKDADISFTDGASYRFELIAGNRKRRYHYYCPKGNSEEYPYINEFSRAKTIIQLIYEYCQLPENYICIK